jgi:hypothetical protein
LAVETHDRYAAAALAALLGDHALYQRGDDIQTFVFAPGQLSLVGRVIRPWGTRRSSAASQRARRRPRPEPRPG